MSRDFQAPNKYLDAVAVNTTGTPIQMGQSGINGFTFHNVWNPGAETLVGTITIEASNDPALLSATTAAQQDAADWVDITSSLTLVNPTSGAGNDMIIINNTRFWWIRLNLSGVSGTGIFSSYPASHGAG